MTRTFLAPDGRELAYQDTHGDTQGDTRGGGQGARPVVLCLPGLTRNSRDFAGVAQHLADRYRVLRLDPRGRGMSEWARDPVAEYTVPVEAGDALALLDHLGIGRAAIIGTSRGGLMGMTIGATQPDRVSALVLNDIGPVIEAAGLEFIMTYLGIEPEAATFEAAARDLEARMGAAFPDLGPAQWVGFARTIFRDEAGRPALSYDPRLRQAVEASLEAGPADLWGLFEALAGLPLLTLRGENSNILSAETLAEMARRRPDMAQATVPRRGHPPFLDEPEARAAIDAFLESHAR